MTKGGLPLKYAGGKAYVAPTIIKLMKQQPHIHYVEPFCGGCQVLFARDPDRNWMATNGEKLSAHQRGSSEIINDLWGELINFYHVLRTPELFPRFKQQIELTPFSEQAWQSAQDYTTGSTVERAVKFLIRFRMSRGGEGKDFTTPVRTRTRGQKQEQVNAFLSAVEGLPDAHERLRRVLILNRDAINVIQSEDTEHTLFYLDPPYPHSTRVKADLYRFEMIDEDHQRMLDIIQQCCGGVILSSYPNDMYNQALFNWNVVDVPLKKSSSSQKNKPIITERLWYNF